MGLFSFLAGKPSLETTVKQMCGSFNSALARGSNIQDALIHMYKTDAVKNHRLRTIPPKTFFSEIYGDDFLNARHGTPEGREFAKRAIHLLVETYFFPELSPMNRMKEFDIFKLAEPSAAEVLVDKYLSSF